MGSNKHLKNGTLELTPIFIEVAIRGVQWNP